MMLTFFALPVRHLGIAFCQKGTHLSGEMFRGLILLHEVYALEEISGRVEHL